MGLFAPTSTPAVGSYSAALNNLTLGPGTPYKLIGLVGWYDATPAPMGGAASLTPRMQSHGSWPMPYYIAARIVTLLIAVEAPVDDGSFADAVASLAQATQPQVDDNGQPVQIPVTIQLGEPDQQTAYGTVSSRQIPTMAPDFNSGVSLATIEVTCPDPRKLGDAATETTRLPQVSGGVTWPATWPISWPGNQYAGNLTITNQGDTTGPMTLRIYGPVTAPTVAHRAPDGTVSTLAFSSSLTIEDGDWVDIDCEARTALYNGQVSRNGMLVSRGWFGFVPGDNVISFNASGYDVMAQLQATGTPAWI